MNVFVYLVGFVIFMQNCKKKLYIWFQDLYRMGRGFYFLFLLIFGAWGNLFSQQLSNQVIVSAAGVVSTSKFSFSQTIGESITDIITSYDFTLTQGFQQPGVKLTIVNPPNGNGVNVYPNPATDYIKIELFGETSRTFLIEVFNINGNTKYIEKLAFDDKFWFIKELDVSDFLSGIYLIRITSEDKLISRTFKIEKL